MLLSPATLNHSVIEREAPFELLFQSNPIPTFVYDWENLKFFAANDAAIAHYGYNREQFLAMSVLDLKLADDHDKTCRAVWLSEGNNPTGWPTQHIKADGSKIDVVVYSRALSFKRRSMAIASVIDITREKRAEQKAFHDALTGLPNRTLLHDRILQGLTTYRRYEESLAVLCLDLEGFKAVNDKFGHSDGDTLLRLVAGRVSACIGETDMVARLSGDVFAIVQVTPLPDGTNALARRLIKLAAEPYDIEGRQVTIGMSVGIAVARDDDNDPNDLLRKADHALYRAKAEAGNTYRFFDYEMSACVKRRKALELDLRTALLREEFELYYQPICSLVDDRIVGVEALLRWHHPERGLVSPAEFSALAEETGLIAPIGGWALRQACAEVAKWPGTISVAVNLSPAQFKSGDLVETVADAISVSGLAVDRLILEITENVLLQENDTTLGMLRELDKLGVKISLDDFGTGYSSLSYLLRYPLAKIKIDQSFIKRLPHDNGCMAIVRAIVGLGKNLGIATTAEGVETEEQLLQLRSLGCDEVQGYLISHPKPSQAIVELLGLKGECKRRAAPRKRSMKARRNSIVNTV